MINACRNVALAAALTVACFAHTPVATAQNENASSNTPFLLDEIIVTAQKREQTLLDVPINVTVTDQSTIDRFNLNEIEKLADFVPGLQVQAQSVTIPSYTIRGVVADGGPPRVALFQNGVTVSDPTEASNMSLFDMERVEVVKGPQATLFGQGALVGGINFINNRATTEETSGAVRLEGGNFSALRGEGHYNMAVNEQFAVRLAGQYKDRDGHVDNVGGGADLGGLETLALRGALHFKPIEQLTADLIINYQDDESPDTPQQSGVFSPDGGPVDRFGASAHSITSDQATFGDGLGSDRTILAATADIEYKLTDTITLTSITDYRDMEWLQLLDLDGTAFDLIGFISDSNAEAFSQELRLSFASDSAWSGFVGLNYFDRKLANFGFFSLDSANFQSLFAPQLAAAAGLDVATTEFVLASMGIPGAENFDNVRDPLQFSALGALLGLGTIPLNNAHLESRTDSSERTSFDIFADVSFEATDRLTLTAGVRITEEELEATQFNQLERGNAALGGGMNALNFETVFITQPDDGSTTGVPRRGSIDTDNESTWRLNAAYRVSDNLNTWLALGRGRRPELLTPTGTGFDVIDAEELDNIEIGMLGRFNDNRLLVSSSAYYSEYTNFQTTVFDEVTGLPTSVNAGNATQFGIELDGQYVVNDNVLMLFTYSHNSSEFDDTDDSGNAQRLAGNTFRISPRNTFSIGADISIPLESGAEISIFPSYSWRSRVFFEDDNSQSISEDGMGGFNRSPELMVNGEEVNEFQDSYGELDLKMSYQPGNNSNLTIYVYGENLLDEDALIDGGNFAGALGIHTFIRNLPRTYGAGITMDF